MDLQNLQLGIIGGGAMAENILKGVLSAGFVSEDRLTVSDCHAQRLTYLKETFRVPTTLDNHELVKTSDTILIAVKPQNMKGLLKDINQVVDDKKLILSIAAGITCQTISEGLSGKGRIIRIMPNIAAKVLESASALCLGPAASPEDLETAKQLFEAIGKTVVVDEELMDAVTGLSGSGPAYIFLIVDALADAGVRSGLSRRTALQLAAQTCFGAAQLILQTGELPAKLKDQVTSPGGTTIAGIHVLEKKAVRGAIMDAVEAAVKRSKELGT